MGRGLRKRRRGPERLAPRTTLGPAETRNLRWPPALFFFTTPGYNGHSPYQMSFRDLPSFERSAQKCARCTREVRGQKHPHSTERLSCRGPKQRQNCEISRLAEEQFSSSCRTNSGCHADGMSGRGIASLEPGNDRQSGSGQLQSEFRHRRGGQQQDDESDGHQPGRRCRHDHRRQRQRGRVPVGRPAASSHPGRRTEHCN